MRNIIADMFNKGVATAYSPDYAASLPQEYPLKSRFEHCPLPEMAPPAPPDVVVLILESWSAYQSALWGGLGNDWTPRLDALARENVWFSNLRCPGRVTTRVFSPLEISSSPSRVTGCRTRALTSSKGTITRTRRACRGVISARPRMTRCIGEPWTTIARRVTRAKGRWR